MFSFYNYGIALAMVSHVIVSTYFVIYETSFVVCGFSRDISAMNASFIIYSYFGCLWVVCSNLSGHASVGPLWAWVGM
jgi:hypothetical protein